MNKNPRAFRPGSMSKHQKRKPTVIKESILKVKDYFKSRTMYSGYKTHPGHMVRMIMKERKLSTAEVQKITGLSNLLVMRLCNCTCTYLESTSCHRLARLGGTPEYWQKLWDDWESYKTEYRERYNKEPPLYYPV